jgi:hypothetical protein
MGYDLHVTRRENWFDEEDSLKISLDKWIQILKEDSEMRLDGFAEAMLSEGNIFRTESDGLAVWLKYSGNGIDGNYAWFSYSDGNIVCKNPDDEIIIKMLEISERLNAKVQGDECEIYTRSSDGKIVTLHS